jgi:uncharacterized protein YbjT (DUF2867 family)
VRVLVTGATGYIGGRLVTRLRERGYDVRCFARAVRRLRGRFDPAVEIVEGDIFDEAALERALAGCDAAYYLVHSMASAHAFEDADRDAARQFGLAASRAGVARIVYLGGLGDEDDALSKHLRSRHEVGTILRSSGVPVVEFRAAMIIGSGSISFEMMRYLTDRLPVMIAPRWVTTRSQPIGIADVLAYLLAALDLGGRANRIYEIGGRDTLTYREMMLRYAALRKLWRNVVVVPFFTPKLSSYWVHLVTPVPARLAQPLILGLRNEVVVRDDAAARDFPQIRPMGFDEAVRRALNRYDTGTETTWFDAIDRRTVPADFTGAHEGMLMDVRVRHAHAAPSRVAMVFSSLGGARGWLAANALWRMRGWLDRLVGGVGLRRGRRSPHDLRVGDAIDFWRVEAYEPDRLLRLRAEMKVPGRAWLQFEAEPDGNGGATLRQSAFFEPQGLAGYLYWYGVAVFHEWVFAQMASRIARAAETAA